MSTWKLLWVTALSAFVFCFGLSSLNVALSTNQHPFDLDAYVRATWLIWLLGAFFVIAGSAGFLLVARDVSRKRKR